MSVRVILRQKEENIRERLACTSQLFSIRVFRFAVETLKLT